MPPKNISSKKQFDLAFRVLEAISIKAMTGRLGARATHAKGGAMARPLEKKTVKGKLYVRPPKIEAAIDLALGQDLDTLRHRALIRDTASPEYLPSECLVHLVRNALRQSNRRDPQNIVANTLLGLLIKRCEANLKGAVSSRIASAEDLREEIISRFGELFAEDLAADGKTKLDYYEVRFNQAFALFRIDAVRPELKRLNRLDNSVKSEVGNEDGDFSEGNIGNDIADADFDLDVIEGKLDNEKQRIKLRAALDELPEVERKALLLHFTGYKVESTDQNERTIATLCKVSGRTIRNRLSRALAKLNRLREAA